MNPILQHVRDLATKGKRLDARKLDEYRDISVETGVVKTAEGSARVKLGKTEVLIGIKLSVGTPYPDTPNEGALMVGAELMPMSNPEFESGPPSIESIELARVIDRGIRESHAINQEKLCITPGEKVWMVSVDICTINADGNLFDAAGIATLAALKDTKFPKYDGETVDYKELTKDPLVIDQAPLPVTISKINEQLFVDLAENEEGAEDGRITATILEDGTVCSLQKGGPVPFSSEELGKVIDLAVEKSKEIRTNL
ncbi:exosome complex protein Rrp42 [Candidatus Woesearchaeota archaeon]|nr:exosome complex protein Rrp42 [Candidatus Woesearchaeota archaeon]